MVYPNSEPSGSEIHPKWSSTLWCAAARVGHNCHFSDCWPPTSNGHNFFVRTLFRVFLDSMEIPLSLEFIHIYLDDVGIPIRSRNHEKIVGLIGFSRVPVHGKPLTSDGHNFFVRTPLQMFLDFMEIPLSLESIHIYLDEIGTHIRSRNHEK